MRKISEAERQRRALQGAMSIDEFCRRHGIGRTTVYAEIKEGRLRARKCGRRTIITDDDRDEWVQHLPVIGVRDEARSARRRARSATRDARAERGVLCAA